MSEAIYQVIPGTDLRIGYAKPVPPLVQYLDLYGRYDHYSKAYSAKIPPKHWVFTQIVNAIWGPQNTIKKFVWHPWAERMNQAVHEHKYVGFAGCASSGKSDFASIYGLVNWMCDPPNTLVLVTSTSLKDSRKRIWAAIVDYWRAAGGDRGLPGRLVDSQGIIRSDDGTGIFTDRAGVALIAGERKKEKEAIGKLIGIKSKHVILVGDEMTDLSGAIFEAAISNLSTNPNFQMLGLGNLYSWYDPFGEFVKPKAGCDSVNPSMEEWETARGICLRFDGERSPNILEGHDIYPFLYGSKDLKEHRDKQGVNSIGYWRMARAFPPPLGNDSIIYSEADLISGHVMDRVQWLTPPTKVASLDPAFTTGGDRSIMLVGAWGQCAQTQNWTLQVEKVLHLTEDVTKRDVPRNVQIVTQFIDICNREKVHPNHAAIDATAAGKLMHDMIFERWSPSVLAVEFGGSPSELPATYGANLKGKEAYDRRVSELWFSGLEFVRGNQVKGLTQEICIDLKARRYDLVKGATVKVRVEPKAEMKKRLGFSCDAGDSWAILLELCRQRLGAIPGGNKGVWAKSRTTFKRRAIDYDEVHVKLYAE